MVEFLEKMIRPEGLDDNNTDRDKQSRLVLRFLHQADKIEAFGGRSFAEVFATEESRREFLAGLTPDQYLELLNGVNGLLRNRPRDQWQMDGDTVEVRSQMLGTAYIPPPMAARSELLQDSLVGVKKMNADNRPLNDIGALLAVSLNAVHPYDDGNGRTGRLVYGALTKDQPEEFLETTLATEGRDVVDFNPAYLETPIHRLLWAKSGMTDASNNPDGINRLFWDEEAERIGDLSADQQAFREIAKKDPKLALMAICEYSKTAGWKDGHLLKVRGAAVVANKIESDLTEEELAEIIANYQSLKTEYTETLIDIFVNPDKPEYQVSEHGQTISLKDHFFRLVQQHTETKTESKRRREAEAEAVKQEQLEMVMKDRAIKDRFNQGEGKSETFLSAEIARFAETTQKCQGIIADQPRNEPTTETGEGVNDELRSVFGELATAIAPDLEIPPEKLNNWLHSHQEELQPVIANYKTALKVIKTLESSGLWDRKFTTSKDLEHPFLVEDFNTVGEYPLNLFFNDLFTQSVYFTNAKGSTQRVLLYAARHNQMDTLLQPVMERAFFNGSRVQDRGQGIVECDQSQPDKRHYIFEISSDRFDQAFHKPETLGVNSVLGIRTITEGDNIHINVTPLDKIHFGYSVVRVVDLDQPN